MSSVLKPRFHHDYHTWRRNKKNKEYYHCSHSECFTQQPRDVLVGKRAECPKCHDLFVLTYENLRTKIPVCRACSKSPKAAEFREQKALADSLIQDMSLPKDIKDILE